VGKYDPLRDYLAGKTGSEVRMTFAEVEELVGPLPDSARIHRAWSEFVKIGETSGC
jgi:hypothetical protein